jgi:hypothetical protein
MLGGVDVATREQALVNPPLVLVTFPSYHLSTTYVPTSRHPRDLARFRSILLAVNGKLLSRGDMATPLFEQRPSGRMHRDRYIPERFS